MDLEGVVVLVVALKLENAFLVAIRIQLSLHLMRLIKAMHQGLF